MGQAKNRGSFEQRKAEAVERDRVEREEWRKADEEMRRAKAEQQELAAIARRQQFETTGVVTVEVDPIHRNISRLAALQYFGVYHHR